MLLGLHSRVSGCCGWVHHTCLRYSDVFSIRVLGGQQWKHCIVQTASVARVRWLSGACHIWHHCFTSYLSKTRYTPAQQKTFIEMFCQLFNTATVKHGSQCVLIVRNNVLHHLHHLREPWALSSIHPLPVLRPTLIIFRATQEERVAQKHNWNWDRPLHCLAAPTT